ncbi:MAG: agmatinase [Paracoccaceae bacterium]
MQQPEDRMAEPDREHRKDYAVTNDDPRRPAHDEQMFSGALSFCRRPYARALDGVDLAVVGVPFDTATSNRPGTRFGPRAIRQASAQLSWSHFWPSPFDPFERVAVADWGDVHLDFGQPQGVPGQIEAAIAYVLARSGAALVLGGDHFVAYPSLKAHAERHGRPLSLIQFDAHCDTAIAEADRIDHGTMFARAAAEGIVDPARSIQIGIRTTYTDPSDFAVHDAIAVHEGGVAATVERVRSVVGDNPAYVSFDIDCLDPAFAPGTGTPVCGGLSSAQGLAILRGLGAAGGTPIRLAGADVVEVSPPYDHAEITALAGATVALALVCLFAEGRAGA